jgi:hypothetical protein
LAVHADDAGAAEPVWDHESLAQAGKGAVQMMDLFALILSGVAGGVVMLMHCTFVNESRAARTREVLNQNEWLEHELKAEKEISLRDRLARADAEYERDEAIHRLHQYGLWEGESNKPK